MFFALAYALSWTAWFAGIYAGSRPELEPYAALANLLGVLGPIGAALLLVVTSGSAALKHDFWDRLFNLRRVRPLYAAFAVAIPIAVICLSILLSLWLGQTPDQFRLSGGAGLIPLVVLALVLAPICEEVGWHGYGADSLRERFGMLPATFLFAVLWCAWHSPLVLLPGTYQHELAVMDSKIFVANFFVSIIPAGIIANWFYYKNNRSIAAAILFHATLNAAAVLIAAGAGRQGHRYSALCGDRHGAHRRRWPSLRRRSAQFPQSWIAFLSSRPEERGPFAERRFGAILILPPRFAKADRRNDAKVWSCRSRRRGPADRGLALVEGRSDERGQIGNAARDGQEVLAHREGGVRRMGKTLPAGLHREMWSVQVRMPPLLAG